MTGPFRPPTGGPANAPGQGGPPPLHPTVGNFGLPGGDVTIERPQYTPPPPAAGPPGWRMPDAPQAPGTFNNQPPQNQPPQYTQPPQNQPPQYNQPPQNQPPQNQPSQNQRVDIPDHVILDGASVPPELRGRSWGQVKQIYGALANDFVMRQTPPPAAPPRREAAPVYEQGRPNGGQPPQGGGFWEDPGGFIETAIDRRLAPVVQRTTAMAIQEARNVAATGIPDWAILEGEVMTILAGANPEALADPRLWTSTAELARGRLMGRGQYDPRQIQGNQQRPAPQPQRGPGGFVPVPPQHPGQFFTEAPTPPANGQGGGYDNGASDIQSRVSALTNDQRAYAAKMQMSLEDYVAWQGGVIQTAPTRRY